MNGKFCFVGAYAASPCHSSWDPEAEEQFLAELSAEEGIAGLELPFFGQIHRWDDAWLLKNLPRHWDHILTCIPGTMERLELAPTFGLASEDADGRRAAIEFLLAARTSIRKLHEAYGRRAVRAVEIHAAPSSGRPNVRSSAKRFRESLEEILSWDWEGTKILVEHCDAWLAGQEAAKGFLPIEDEIEAVMPLAHPDRLGLLVNWGRSAIEGRSPDTPVQHLKKAAEHEVLGGLIFSGATIDDPLYGRWKDSHAPFGPPSLMTREQVIRCLRLCKRQETLLGFKIQALPRTLTVQARAQLVRGWLKFLEDCVNEAWSHAPNVIDSGS